MEESGKVRSGWPYEAPQQGQMRRSLVRVARAVPAPLLKPVRLALVNGAARRVREETRSVSTIAGMVELSFEFAYGPISIRPFQVPAEIEQLLELLAIRSPETVLELGTASGGSLFLFTRVAAPDALLVSVDLPGGPFGGGYDPTRARLYRSFAREAQRVELVKGDSHAYSTQVHVRRLLGGRSVDFLMIDGDHSPAGIRADFSDYAELVAPGGMIAFHDIVPGAAQRAGGVAEFWRELRRTSHDRESKEIVDDWDQQGFGIGVLHV